MNYIIISIFKMWKARHKMVNESPHDHSSRRWKVGSNSKTYAPEHHVILSLTILSSFLETSTFVLVSFSWETNHLEIWWLKATTTYLGHDTMEVAICAGLSRAVLLLALPGLTHVWKVSRPVSWYLEELDGPTLISGTLAGRARMIGTAGPLSTCSLIL